MARERDAAADRRDGALPPERPGRPPARRELARLLRPLGAAGDLLRLVPPGAL